MPRPLPRPFRGGRRWGRDRSGTDPEPDGASAADAWRRRLTRSVSEAWRVFDRAAGLPSRVTPAAPFLFFGDLAATCAHGRSEPLAARVPGRQPIPALSPAERREHRPRAEPLPRRDVRLLPHVPVPQVVQRLRAGARWRRNELLHGQGFDGASHRHLSPVATNPTWRKLDKTDRADLQADGGPLWHTLLETLRPHMVVLSVARDHLGRIEFAPVDQWRTIHEFERKRDGDLRKTPYAVRGRWYEAGGERSLFVFGRAARTPFRG